MMKGLFILVLFFCVTLFISGCNDGSTDPAGSPPNIIISRYEIAHDNNGDSLANPGEEVYLKLWAKNTGEAPAHIVVIKEVKSLSSNIYAYWNGLVFSTPNNFAEIGGGQEALLSEESRLSLIISPKTEVDSTYKILINFIDEDRREWFDTLEIKVVKHGANIILSRYVLNSDNNDNGKANPGETLDISLALKNIGSSGAKKVSLVDCESSTKNITIKYFNYHDFQYGDLEPGQELFAWNNEELVLGIGNLIKADSTYDIYLKIADEDENVWYDTLSIYVEKLKADIKISRVLIEEDENSDGKPNPGEIISIRIYIKNVGSDPVQEVRVDDFKYDEKLVYLTYYFPNVRYGKVLPGEEKKIDAAYGRYSIGILPKVAKGTKLPFAIKWQDDNGSEWEDTFEFTVE